MKTSLIATTALCVAFTAIPDTAFARRRTSSSDPDKNSSTAKTFPILPSGWLTASPQVVQAGTRPTLTWGINYPSIVEDYVTIIPPATLEADEEVDCEIRILGAGVTATSYGSSDYTFVPTEALMSVGGGSYQRIFYGTNLEVNPNQVVSTFTLGKNQKLKFGGRYYYNRSWGPLFNSDSGTDNVRSLVNRDTPPSNVPDYNAPSLESFIKPYLSQDGKTAIGPMDVILFMELTHYDSQQSDPGYDLQDLVILVTFKSKAKNNNGHGNNLDGIDSSNPGSAPFIDLDSDPTVDDEAP